MKKILTLLVSALTLSSLVAQTPLRNEAAHPRKTILIEHYTGEWCHNCPKADPFIKAIHAKIQNKGLTVNHLSYHLGDRYEVSGANHLLGGMVSGQRYGVPAISFNRGLYGLATDDNVTPQILFYLGSLDDIYAKLDREILRQELVEIQNITTDPVGGNSFTTRISGRVFDGLDKDNLYLSAVLVEDNVDAARQSNKPAGFVHQNLVRSFLTSFKGTKVTVKDDNTFVVDLGEKKFGYDWKKEDTRVVVFLHSSFDRPQAERGVYTSLAASMQNTMAVDAVDASLNVAVVDGKIVVNGNMTSFEVYNMHGERLAADATLVKGDLYVVRVENAQGVVTLHKIIF